MALKFHLVVIGFIMLFGVQSANAQQIQKQESNLSFTLWPSLVSTQNPSVAPTGDYVVSRNPYLNLWKIKNGIPEILEWKSRTMMAGFYPLAYSWDQNDLLVSRIKKDDVFVDDDTYKQFGDTVLISEAKDVVPLIPKSYRSLLTSRSGKFLAAMFPTGTDYNDREPTIDFYTIDRANRKATLISSWKKKIKAGLSIPSKLVAWSDDEKGIFVAFPESYFSKDDQEDVEKTGLYFVSLTGQEKSVLPEPAWLVANSPRPVVTKGSQLFSAIEYFGATSYIGKVSPDKVEESILWRDVRNIIRQKTLSLRDQNPRLLALAPNGRVVIIQEMGKNENQDYLRLRQVWAVDIKIKRRRKLAMVSQLSVRGWCAYGLLTALFTKEYGDEYLYAVLNCPEAFLDEDSTELQKLIESSPWENKPD